jgi:hypothetical protein
LGALLMNQTSRRRSLLEMLVCVLLVATFAGHPALGDKDGAKLATAAASSDGSSAEAAPSRDARAIPAAVSPRIRNTQASEDLIPPDDPATDRGVRGTGAAPGRCVSAAA